MKKVIAIIALLVGTQAFGMTNVPNGEYEGEGRWRDDQGQAGSYVVETSISSGMVSSTYEFNGQTEVFEFEAKPDSNGFFDVHAYGNEVGKGYCMSVQCHYELMFGNTTVEETLTFWQSNLYRVGSKVVDGKHVIWEESLTGKRHQ